MAVQFSKLLISSYFDPNVFKIILLPIPAFPSFPYGGPLTFLFYPEESLTSKMSEARRKRGSCYGTEIISLSPVKENLFSPYFPGYLKNFREILEFLCIYFKLSC